MPVSFFALLCPINEVKILAMVNIGKYCIKANIILSPLAGCSDLSFRLVCRQMGAKFAFFEMSDANALVYAPLKRMDILKTVKGDQPIAAQILCADEKMAVKAAQRMLKLIKPKFIDINAACPTKKVIKKKAGSHLLREPKTLFKIISSMVKHIKLPITVKLRVGFYQVNIPEIVAIAKGCEKSGAAALFVHGRTAAQGYSGEVNYAAIKAIKEAVRIPVFGSGSIMSGPLAKKMLDETGCDGVMVARGAFGNPWIFKEIEGYLKTGKLPPAITLTQRKKILKKHLAYVEKYKDCRLSGKIGFMRKICLWYLKAFWQASETRRRITQCQSYAEFVKLINGLGKG